jgi:sugar transferase (PEP-CTERM/EpsH1 system associated)
MAKVLLLVHRIPFPPDKGDKIRSFHLLNHLHKRHHVFLGAFIDDNADRQYESNVSMLCEELCLLPVHKKKATIRSLIGFVTGEALTVVYYKNNKMQRWVDGIIKRHKIDHIIVFSSSMAQYVESEALSCINRVIDFVDIDSDKWRQYSKTKHWPLSWVYRRESTKLLNYESRIASRFNASTFVSKEEAKLFRSLVPAQAHKIHYYNNGVDHKYYSKSNNFDNPYPVNSLPIVFVGAMDYWANVDAVYWFAKEIFPKIRLVNHSACYFIVGSNPAMSVKNLADEANGIHVTGKVEDTRPFLAHAAMSIINLRIARGIQNKVLEAMAMGCPVIVSSQAIEGIDAQNGRDYRLANTIDEFVQQIVWTLAHPEQVRSMAVAARLLVEQKYSWSENLRVLDQWLQ